ncbi:hypothetical protein TNCV_1111031 [Trichonephila clavipes]|nr:hypothetical protein TNCV_1111031 [Trichonephila clavipes]
MIIEDRSRSSEGFPANEWEAKNAKKGCEWNLLRGSENAQKRAEALIQSAVQLMLIAEFLEQRTINFDECCETLRSLRRSIGITYVELAKFQWKQLDQPPYSPDISP